MVKGKSGNAKTYYKPSRNLVDVFIEGIVYALGVYTGKKIKSFNWKGIDKGNKSLWYLAGIQPVEDQDGFKLKFFNSNF